MSEEKKDYGKTLNLPNTEFPMRGNLPEKEPKIKEAIFDNGLYEKMLKKNEGKKSYVLHDGPPYANGEIHMGHALNKVLKDITDAKLIFLIMQVNEKYLPYILNKTLKEEKTILKLINNLYLLGSKRWLNIINYIKNQRESVLSKGELKKLEMFADNTLSRKRTLT